MLNLYTMIQAVLHGTTIQSKQDNSTEHGQIL